MNRDERTPLERYLDGETDLDGLPPADRHDEARLVEFLAAQRRSGVRAPDGLRTDVMREIEALPRNRWQDLLSWFLRPRTLHWNPAAAAALAVAALAVLMALPDGDPAAPPRAGEAVADGVPAVMAGRDADAGALVVTRFVFVAPEASTVTLTGDWVGWDAEEIPLRELRGSGVWTVDVPVPAGVHEYAFVVDGSEWRPDPLAGSQTDDGFGRTNSVLLVSNAEV